MYILITTCTGSYCKNNCFCSFKKFASIGPSTPHRSSDLDLDWE